MPITENNDYIEEARELLLEQYQDKERIEALLKSYIAQLQELENVIFDLYSERLIDTAEGAQLDQLGELVNQPRIGPDATYRIFIKARIAINRSNGQIAEILHILELITPGVGNYRLEETGDASFIVELMGPANLAGAQFLLPFILDATAGGVLVQLLFNQYYPSNRYQLSSQSGTLESSSDQGLANSSQTTGGRMNGVI